MNDLTQSRWLPIVLPTCSNLFRRDNISNGLALSGF
ncbi:MAG: hypothetical protein QOD03_1193 [Verrucomicrobiota bacterium]|jgi:hypothetical protein